MNAEGNRLVQLRRAAGLSHSQLAKKLGVTSQAVSAWERGINVVRFSVLGSMRRVLGVTSDELIEAFEDARKRRRRPRRAA